MYERRRSTNIGLEEGITMLSTLLCTRGGIITIEKSGQVSEEYDKKSFDDINEFKMRYEGLIESLIDQYDIKMDITMIGKIIYVESQGNGYDDTGRMFIRFENHKFLERILVSQDAEMNRKEFEKYFECNSGSWRNQKIKIGEEFVPLHPTGTINDNDLQYTALNYAMFIDTEAAYQSISMGIGQILGINYESAGYESAQEMYVDMSQGYSNQIEAMIRHIKNTGLDEKSLEEIFEIYNGPDNVEEYKKRYNEAIW